MFPNYVDNKIKYQRALAEAKNPNNEAEVKAIYTSYGGKLIGETEVAEAPIEAPEAIVEPVEPIVEAEVITHEVTEEEIKDNGLEDVLKPGDVIELVAEPKELEITE